MLKLVWENGKAVWVPVTEQEDADRVAMIMAVRNMPAPIANSGIRYCYCYDPRDEEPGQHAKAEYSPETGGYDYLYAELCMEKNAEKAKVRNRRRNDRKYPENKAERKKEKHNRMCHLYGRMFEDGNVWLWEYGKEGSKQTTEPGAEIVRNLKTKELERIRREYDAEPAEHIVGYSTIERTMYNADKSMREIRARYAENGYETECDIAEKDGRMYAYPDDYYYFRDQWNYCQYMVETYGMAKANRRFKGED